MNIQTKAVLGFVSMSVVACAYLLQSGTHITEERNVVRFEERGQHQYREWMMTRDPKTNRIPDGIRFKEMQFAKTIPTVEALARTSKVSRFQGQQWMARGPINRGGRTRALAYDISNTQRILAGGQTNGMWLSEDGGGTWKRTTVLSAHPSVTSVIQDKREGKTNIWYYTSGEHSSSARGGGETPYDGDGVFKSSDGGKTWAVLPATAQGNPQTKYAFSHTWSIVTDNSNKDQDVVYVAAASSIQRSSDGGATWSSVLESPKAEHTDVAITSTGVLYATLDGDNKGIFRSTNGTEWTKIIPSSYPSVNKRITIGIAPSNENIVYFFGETPNSGKQKTGSGDAEWHSLHKYTYKSGNGAEAGGDWEDRSQNIPAFGGKVGEYSSQNSYDIFVSVKPDNPDVVFLGGTNLYRSTDGFASSTNTAWVAGYATKNDISQYEEHHPDLHANVFKPGAPNILLSGHDGGISITEDCLAAEPKWKNISTGYITSQFYAIAIDRNAPSKIIVGGLQDNGSYATDNDDISKPWEIAGSGDGGFAEVIDSVTFMSSSQNGEVNRFTKAGDGGEVAPPQGATGMLFITPYTADAADTKIIYYQAGNQVWRSLDITKATKTSGWEKLDALQAEGTITALATSKTPAHILFYGTGTGLVYKATGSNTATPEVKNISGTNFPKDAYVSCVAVNPDNADNIYVVFSNYSVLSIFESNNGGTSWTPISGNLEQNADGTGNGPSCRWLAVMPVQGGKPVLYVGTSTGLYSTSNADGMNTVWAQEGANMIGNVVVSMVLARKMDGMIVVATHASGIYSTIFNPLATVRDEEKNIEVLDNYPEPFSNATTVRYNVKTPANVSVTLYDITGRAVQTLVSERKDAGMHEARLDAVSLPNGRFMVNVRAGSSTSTRMITVNR
ncbi:MAG: T9SS type A sorting domain-containing protein [Candidatus Kapabacteria bacterium]|nr:T9SS type A sorting domain-containing protein [Candidatus Kapabacteria bacterium]